MAAATLTCGGAASRSFLLQALTGRWLMVFASMLIMSMSGATYMFGAYSGAIKSSMEYDQTTLNLLGFFKDLGANIGIMSGIINEVMPPWVVLAIGVAMNFSGYFMIWLAVTGRTSKPPVWQMCLYICIGANSQTFSNTGALVTCVKNFPESRGIVIGLLKGFTGLSGAIITQIYHALYGTNSKDLIFLIGWLPAAVNCFFLRTVRLMKLVRQENEQKIFYHLLYISLILAGSLMILIILQNSLDFSKPQFAGGASVVVFFLFAPIAVVIREECMIRKAQKSEPKIEQSQLELSSENPQSSAETSHLPPQPPPYTAAAQPLQNQNIPVPWWRDVFNPPERGEDYNILQALFSIDMIILFIAVIFGVGGTLTAIDNLGQMGKSLGYPSKSITTFVSLVSIWNYLGRVASGFSSEIFLAKYKFPRPLMLTFVLLLSCVGHLLIAFGVPNSLYFASVIIGFCFGAQWPLIFAIISELFGLKYYSTLHTLGGAASPLGAYILNVRITGPLYDKEALRQMVRREGEDLSCSGGECYKLAFLIITAATLVGCFVSFVLVLRTRKFYKGDIYKKFREQGIVDANGG